MASDLRIREFVSAAVVAILILISAVGASVDTDIINAAGINSLDFFHVTLDRKVMLKTELDLVLTVDQYKTIYARSDRGKRKALSDMSTRWPKAVVSYEIMKGLENDISKITSVMDEWSKYTCLSFKENKTAENRVQFVLGNGCSSYLGMAVGSKQQIVVNPSCLNNVILLHLFGHTLGFVHEHMRPDRDKYIKVNMKGIPLESMINFGKVIQEKINTYNVGYDFSSIMHYESSGIIQTLDTSYQEIIGNVQGLSFGDIKIANLMYDCAKKGGCPDKQCPFNGFVLPKPYKGSDKCQCWCRTADKKNSDPLVLCSAIQKEAPGYSLSAASTLASTMADCADLRENCGILKGKGFCSTEFKKMKQFCSKTCNFCGKGGNVCMDLENGCDLMARGGSCEDKQLQDVMFKICPKSCNRCQKVSTGCEIQNALTSQ